MPQFLRLTDVLPRNGFAWPHGSRLLSRGQKDAAVSKVLREHVGRFVKAEVEPLLTDLFVMAASAVKRTELKNMLDIVDDARHESAWARKRSFALFFELFLAIRNPRYEYCAQLHQNLALAAQNRHHPGPLALAVDQFLRDSSHISEPREKLEEDPDRALGGIDEELYLLARDPRDDEWMTSDVDAGPPANHTFVDDGRRADDRRMNYMYEVDETMGNNRAEGVSDLRRSIEGSDETDWPKEMESEMKRWMLGKAQQEVASKRDEDEDMIDADEPRQSYDEPRDIALATSAARLTIGTQQPVAAHDTSADETLIKVEMELDG